MENAHFDKICFQKCIMCKAGRCGAPPATGRVLFAVGRQNRATACNPYITNTTKCFLSPLKVHAQKSNV